MFHSPLYLLLLLLVPLIAWRLFRKRQGAGVRISTIQFAKQLPRTFRQRMLWLPPTLTIAAMVCLIVGIARPQDGREQTIIDSEGIAIQMVVDRSGSMRAMDFRIDGQPVDRLTAIKNVASKFVVGGQQLDGRVSDLVGLITFAGYADAIAPPTLDHAFLVSQLNEAEIVTARGEDGTAIGDAISLAVEKLNSLDQRQEEKIKSKVIILLTDGENTAGELEPVQAAELAETLGIKVYTIGVGTIGQAPMIMLDPFSGRQVQQMVQVNIDEETLTKVAQLTGGKYYRATDTDSLEKIYAEIDALEKTKVEAQHYTDYLELAVQPYNLGSITIPPILMLAFVLLACRWLLQETWLRELC